MHWSGRRPTPKRWLVDTASRHARMADGFGRARTHARTLVSAVPGYAKLTMLCARALRPPLRIKAQSVGTLAGQPVPGRTHSLTRPLTQSLTRSLAQSAHAWDVSDVWCGAGQSDLLHAYACVSAPRTLTFVYVLRT